MQRISTSSFVEVSPRQFGVGRIVVPRGGGEVSWAYDNTGFTSPGAVAMQDGGLFDWYVPGSPPSSDPADLLAALVADDLSFVQAEYVGGAGSTEYLDCTGFGFSLPAGSEILGVTAKVKIRSYVGQVTDQTIRLRGPSGLIGDNKARVSFPWGSSWATIEFGASDDLWGATISQSDVENSLFGIRIKAEITSPAHARIDYVALDVDYRYPE